MPSECTCKYSLNSSIEYYNKLQNVPFHHWRRHAAICRMMSHPIAKRGNDDVTMLREQCRQMHFQSLKFEPTL